LILWVAQVAHVESAFAVADIALNVVFGDKAAAAIFTTVVIAVAFSTAVPAIAPRLFGVALLADFVLGWDLLCHTTLFTNTKAPMSLWPACRMLRTLP